MFSFSGSQNNNVNNNTNNTSTSFGSFAGTTNNNNNNNNIAHNQQQTGFSGLQSFQSQQKPSDPIERLTRVSDLPNDAQNLIEQLNQHIQSQVSISDQFALNEESLNETVDSVSNDVSELQRRWGTTNSFLLNDQNHLENLRDLVHGGAENLLISTRFVDGIRSGSLNIRGSADHILKYFFQAASGIESDMEEYDKIVTALEQHVSYAKDVKSSQDAATLVEALKAQHGAYMRLASKVATVHDRVTQDVQ